MATSSIYQHAQHEIGQFLGCVPGWHCAIHEVDEPGTGYLRCGECAHAFTRWSLWWAHLCIVARIARIDRQPLYLIVGLFTRPAHVQACPHCAHDL